MIETKEIRNSRELITFLELNVFCPEFLVNCPTLLYKSQEPSHFCVRLFKFLPESNIFVTASNSKRGNKSNLKFYSFRESSLVEDKYRLDSTKINQGGRLQASTTNLSKANPVNKTSTAWLELLAQTNAKWIFFLSTDFTINLSILLITMKISKCFRSAHLEGC